MGCDSSVRLSSWTSGTLCTSSSPLLSFSPRDVLFIFLLLNCSLKDSGEQKLYYYIFIIELYYAMMLYIVFFTYMVFFTYIVFFTYCGFSIKEVSTQNSVALAEGLYPKPDGNLLRH